MKKVLTLILSLFLIVPSLHGEDRDATVELLFDRVLFDVSDTPVGIIPGQGLCTAIGNKIVGLDADRNDRFKEIILKDSTVTIDGFTVIGNHLVFRSDKSIIWNTLDDTMDGITFADKEFSIAPASDTTLFVIHHPEKELFEISLKNKKSLWSSRMDEPVVTLTRIGRDIVTVTTRHIALFIDGEWNIMHTHPVDITSAAFTSHGIFFGTSDALWRLHGPDEIEHVATGNVSCLLSDGDRLYVIDGENNVYAVSFSRKPSH